MYIRLLSSLITAFALTCSASAQTNPITLVFFDGSNGGSHTSLATGFNSTPLSIQNEHNIFFNTAYSSSYGNYPYVARSVSTGDQNLHATFSFQLSSLSDFVITNIFVNQNAFAFFDDAFVFSDDYYEYGGRPSFNISIQDSLNPPTTISYPYYQISAFTGGGDNYFGRNIYLPFSYTNTSGSANITFDVGSTNWTGSLHFGLRNITVTGYAIPEPSTYALFGLGAIVMLMVVRRKKTA